MSLTNLGFHIYDPHLIVPHTLTPAMSQPQRRPEF